MSSNTSDSALKINQLPITVDIPKNPDDFYDYLSLHIKRVSNAVNTKTGGLYTLQEQFSSNQYFTPNNPEQFRNVYRLTFDMVAQNGGPIAHGATVSVAHNIPLPNPISNLNGVHIFGSATNSDITPKRMPLPYSSQTTTLNIEVYFNDTNVVLINGATQTTLTYATLVWEYPKN
jgi:hypothetical protein